jgi:hypothetical protein
MEKAMRDDFLMEHMKSAIRSLKHLSDEEWFAEMEAAGVLDADGKVVRRMPEPPKGAEEKKRPARRRKPRRI